MAATFHTAIVFVYILIETIAGKLAMLPALIFNPTTALLLVLSVAVAFDIAQHRIPNRLTLGALGFGLSLQSWQQGISGFAESLAGIVTGFLILLPFYLAKGMRAGDIKLMAAVGAFLGFQTALAAGFSLILGMFLGLAILLWNGGGKAWFSRYSTMLMLLAGTGKWYYQPPARDEIAATSFPYAAAIASGTLIVLLIRQSG